MNWFKKAQLETTLPYFQEFEEYGDYVPDQNKLNDTLNDMGIKIVKSIGSGDSGVAYELSNGDVLKITTNQQEGKVANFLMNNSCPSIITYKKVWKDGDLYFIILEKLDKMVSSNIVLNNIFLKLEEILEKHRAFSPQESISVLEKDSFFQSLPLHIKSSIFSYISFLTTIPIKVFDFLNPNNIGIKDGKIKFFDIT